MAGKCPNFVFPAVDGIFPKFIVDREISLLKFSRSKWHHYVVVVKTLFRSEQNFSTAFLLPTFCTALFFFPLNTLLPLQHSNNFGIFPLFSNFYLLFSNFQFLHSHNSNQYLITCVLPLETLFKKEEQIRCCFI